MSSSSRLTALVATAVYFASNPAFEMLSVSEQYAAAGTEAERATYLAGEAMFTLFNENAFLVSYVIVSASWSMISGVMLRSDVFSRLAAYAGILAGAAGIITVVLEHVTQTPAIRALAIAVYFTAIAFLFIWVLLAGRRLYQLGAT